MGYGEDGFCAEATRLLRAKLDNERAQVHFVSGGTQANLIALASMLKPFESVIAAATAHINVHEAGAVEATGHKIHNVPCLDGKLTPPALQEVVSAHTDEHMVKPRVVFLSQATELGTIYTKTELEAISKVCRTVGLFLYLDGARLGSALASSGADMTLSDIAQLTDLFYIGGTKNGLLLGEAIVIVNPALQENFRYHLKQRGALLAKGRILGIQFSELFRDDLFFEIAHHANDMAQILSRGIEACGYTFLVKTPTNQIFPILPNSVIEELKKKYGFYVWSRVDEKHSCIRLVTSWATPGDAVNEFLADLKAISQ
jgi:threonine aldolase